ncbi:MAG TPA: GNAT family protein [Streptosporangiaceae bacterium]|nr:GNAT family protein [Streptosporangiaceae bacterium]
MPDVIGVRLRPVREADLAPLEENELREADPWNWFTYVPTGVRRRRFAADGMLSEEAGTLAVEAPDGALAGTVSWFTVKHGPSAACQALNIGISLLPGQRGRGYGAAAQRALAEYLFATTLVERIEAETDVENVAEQRALERAGFTREGVLRHSQFRAGRWRDNVIYSVLRAEVSLDQF